VPMLTQICQVLFDIKNCVLKLKSRTICTILCPLTFTHPLTSLVCHSVRMFVQLCYLGQTIFRNITTMASFGVT